MHCLCRRGGIAISTPEEIIVPWSNAFQGGKFGFQTSSCRRGQNPAFLLAVQVDGKVSSEASISLALEKWKIAVAPLHFEQRINCKAAPCTRDSCQGRQRDAFAVHKCYGLRRTLLPAGFCWCKARNPVDDWACQKKHCVSFVLEEIQEAMWLLWLTSSLLIPSLLVVGSMLQSPCNLESFGAYTN